MKFQYRKLRAVGIQERQQEKEGDGKRKKEKKKKKKKKKKRKKNCRATSCTSQNIPLS